MSDDPNDGSNPDENDTPVDWEQFANDPIDESEPPSTEPARTVGSDEEMVGDDRDILDETLGRKTRAEYSEVNRNRDALLDSVGLRSAENKALQGRIDSLKIDGLFALLPDDPMEQIDRYRVLVEGRLKSLPTYAYYDLKPKKKIDGSVSIRSDRMVSIVQDADEIQKSLTLSASVIASLYEKLHEQIALHEELLAHAKTVKQTQQQAMAALPGWSMELARFVEALGLQSETVKRNRTEIHNALREALAEFVADEKRSDNMVAYLEESAAINDANPTPSNPTPSNDVTTANVAEPIAGAGPILEASPLATVSIASTVEPASIIVEEADTDVIPQGLIAPTALDAFVDEPQKPAPSECRDFNPAEHEIIPFDPERTSLQPTPGFCRIEGIKADHRFSGLFSQFDYNCDQNLKPGCAKRMDERSQDSERWNPYLNALGFGIPSSAWIQYDVPLGDYVLVQKKGRSPILPSYLPDTYLPPHCSFETCLKFLDEVNLKFDQPFAEKLTLWDCGVGDTHKVEYKHYYYGKHEGGDPQQAHDVMRQTIPIHLRLTKQVARKIEPSEIAKEHMARFWLFLVVGRMRGNMLNELWPDGFFHGVHGFDHVLGDEGHMVLYRKKAGSITNSIAYTMG